MEKMTRVKKYRELRESINEDATLPKQEIKDQDDMEDTFFIPTLKEYRLKQQKQANKSVFFETSEILQDEIDQESIENIEKAISKVRETSGKGESYNTRLDILNQLNKKHQQDSLSKTESKYDNNKIVSNPGTNIDENGFELTSEFDFEPLSKSTTNTKETNQQQEKQLEKEEVIEIKDEDDAEQSLSKEDPGIMMKILTGLIVILSLCLIGLLVYIVKLFLF